MCYANITQHSGCSHIGEVHTQPLTLCDHAIKRLFDLRGPNSPPVYLDSPPESTPATNVPQTRRRSSSKRRFLSWGNKTLSRASSAASQYTNFSSFAPSRTSTSTTASSFTPTTTVQPQLDYAALPAHQLSAVRCPHPIRRSQVTTDMDVCPSCKKALMDMRNMLERYDKTGSIRGTAAFEQFLRFSDDEGFSSSDQQGDVTIAIRDSVAGEMLGARQAIVMGHAGDGAQLRERGRGRTWDRNGDGGEAEWPLDDHVRGGGPMRDGPQQALVMRHPSDASFFMKDATHGLGYWNGDDVSSLATSRVFRDRDDASSLATSRVFR